MTTSDALKVREDPASGCHRIGAPALQSGMRVEVKQKEYEALREEIDRLQRELDAEPPGWLTNAE